MAEERMAELLERLRSGRLVVRLEAAKALGEMGEGAVVPEVLEALVERLKDENEWVRMEAAQALGGMGPAAAAPEVVGALLERFWDEEGDVGSAAAQALGWLAADYPEVVLAILPHLRDASERVRGHALFALDSMLDALEIRPVPATPEVLEALRECLGGEQDVRVRQVVARLLGMMGRAAGRPARSPVRPDRRRSGGGWRTH
jgi:HEAT repeat protein